MKKIHLQAAPLAFLLLAGCSSHMIEDVSDVTAVMPPKACGETTKLFDTFSMRATRTAWADSTLTVELTIDNDKNYPIALSNSGNGLLYTIEISLQDGKGKSIAPQETGGVAIAPAPKKFKAPQARSVLGVRRPAKIPNSNNRTDNTRNLNFRIVPGQPEPARLVFHAPRENYLLTIQRKFSGKPDVVAACKISAG